MVATGFGYVAKMRQGLQFRNCSNVLVCCAIFENMNLGAKLQHRQVAETLNDTFNYSYGKLSKIKYYKFLSGD